MYCTRCLSLNAGVNCPIVFDAVHANPVRLRDNTIIDPIIDHAITIDHVIDYVVDHSIMTTSNSMISTMNRQFKLCTGQSYTLCHSCHILL